ncbi:MAG: hypothetical protein ACE5Q6_19030, partial [Dehalococcoidia bacterium]
MSTDPSARIEERIRECKVERRSYEIWLKYLTPANFLLVGVGGILSLVAGLSIVTEVGLIDAKVAGWMVVLGVALTGLHTLLKCDPHQAECKRLANQFSALQTKYEILQLETDEQTKKEQLMSLERDLATIRDGRGASANDFCVTRAKKECENQA